MDRALPASPGHRPGVRAAGWPYPADLGPRCPPRHPHRRRPGRGRSGSHGACPCGADRQAGGGDGHRWTWRHQHGDGHRQCLDRPHAGAAHRRLPAAAAGQHGAAPRHPARRHPAPRDAPVAHRARAGAGVARAGRGHRTGDRRPRRARPCLHRDPDRRAPGRNPVDAGAGRVAGAYGRHEGRSGSPDAAPDGRATRWCGCSTRPAHSTSTRKRAAGLCRRTIPPWLVPCARRR